MNHTYSYIKELRKSLNQTQIEFSQSIGISQAHLSKIECGKEKPSKTVEKLIDILYLKK